MAMAIIENGSELGVTTPATTTMSTMAHRRHEDELRRASARRPARATPAAPGTRR